MYENLLRKISILLTVHNLFTASYTHINDDKIAYANLLHFIRIDICPIYIYDKSYISLESLSII